MSYVSAFLRRNFEPHHAPGKIAPIASMSPLHIPPVLKAIFDSFPLWTVPNDPLPSGCSRPNIDAPSLYVFTTSKDAANGNPSFNPSCLKWQTYLKFCGTDCRIVPSNNHASPSGALPFLITAGTFTSTIPSNGLGKWARESSGAPKGIDAEDPQVQAVLSLLNSQIRDAWLYALYLEPTNFTTLASVQYRSTSVSAVNFLLSHQMQAAATQELLQARPGGIINSDDIYADAESAISALSTILGDDEWFFGGKKPGVFDAALFGYTHLILTLKWDEKEAGLMRAVKRYGNLVTHERSIRKRWYPNVPV